MIWSSPCLATEVLWRSAHNKFLGNVALKLGYLTGMNCRKTWPFLFGCWLFKCEPIQSFISYGAQLNPTNCHRDPEIRQRFHKSPEMVCGRWWFPGRVNFDSPFQSCRCREREIPAHRFDCLRGFSVLLWRLWPAAGTFQWRREVGSVSIVCLLRGPYLLPMWSSVSWYKTRWRGRNHQRPGQCGQCVVSGQFSFEFINVCVTESASALISS